MGYLCIRVANAEFRTDTPERRAFAEHLTLVAKALHDIEWVDSSDFSPGEENAAIRACVGNGAVLQAAIDAAREATETLRAELDRAEQRA